MSLKAFSLNGKLALVTGGGAGIGLGISRAFIQAGARVVITGRRESVLKEATNELGNQSGVKSILNGSYSPKIRMENIIRNE